MDEMAKRAVELITIRCVQIVNFSIRLFVVSYIRLTIGFLFPSSWKNKI